MIPHQPEFCLALPTVYGPKDYRDFRAVLEHIDRFLVNTGIETRFIESQLLKHEGSSEWTETDWSEAKAAVVLTHNLWKIAVMAAQAREEKQEQKKAS